MTPRAFRLAAFALLAPAFARAQGVTIDHQPVSCAAADRHPEIRAGLQPAAAVAKARVVFQGANPQEWYSVAMRRDADSFTALLPQPRPSLKTFTYYIEVTDSALGTVRTEEFKVVVAEARGACRGLMAATVASASVAVQGPAGLPALPAGFSSTGIVTGSAAGSAAAAAVGGGLSKGAIAGIAAGVGGAVVAGAALSGSEEAAPASSVAGQWVGTWRDSDPTPNCGTLSFSTTMTLSQNGASISGAMVNLLTTAPPASGCAAQGTSFSGPISSGSVSGSSIQFVATLNTVSPARIFTFTGSVSGTSISGSYVTTIAEFPTFQARGTLSATKQ